MGHHQVVHRTCEEATHSDDGPFSRLKHVVLSYISEVVVLTD